MDSLEEGQFEPNMFGTLMLELAQERSLDLLLEKLVNRALLRPKMACLQVWLVDSAGVSAGGAPAARPAAHLRMVAGKGKSVCGAQPDDRIFFDPKRRIALGEGWIGKTAASGQQMTIGIWTEPAVELPDAEWLVREKIQSFGCTSIQYKGEILGAIVGFTREEVQVQIQLWGKVLADHIGAAIANARAFEEIQQLKAQLELQNTYLQEEVEEAKAFGDLIGQSAALRQVISQIDLVAPTAASVLIMGETGTGKELVAREIHRRSERRDKPLVRVNCASIPRELYESEFFGHIRGAFTGAVKDRAGRFETAEGGSLFLDEVGEIPIELQGKLLRVLQEKRYERVGDDKSRTADVRIIAATNRDLKKEVALGRFRQDLYYRLHVFPIQVSLLKERLEDIPLLAEHFVNLSVRELRCPKPRLTRAAVAQLLNYHWPGNVRELRNVIQRAVILARGGPLQFDLPVTGSPPKPSPQKALPGEGAGRKFLTEAEMQWRERENLVRALEEAQWKVMGSGGAAELLGIKPTTLFSRMKKLGIERETPKS